MNGGSPFAYAVYRVVPSVERGERMNVGVVVCGDLIHVYIPVVIAGRFRLSLYARVPQML